MSGRSSRISRYCSAPNSYEYYQMNLRPRLIAAVAVIGVVIYLTRGLIPAELWLLIGAVVSMAVITRRMADREAGTQPSFLTAFSGQAQMADDLEPIQRFLNEKRGHYRFDIWNHPDSINEDTIEKKLDGTHQEFYAVVGVRELPADEYDVVQLFVWNRTKNRKHAYYRNVQNSDMQHDPLYRHYKRRFLKTEGSGESRQDKPWTGASINIDQSTPGEHHDRGEQG